MAQKLNVYAFIASLLCVGLFLLTSFTSTGDFVKSLVKVHPLDLVLVLSIVSFLLGLFGFSGARDWKSFVRSLVTVLITLGLSVVLIFIIGIGHLLG